MSWEYDDSKPLYYAEERYHDNDACTCAVYIERGKEFDYICSWLFIFESFKINQSGSSLV